MLIFPAIIGLFICYFSLLLMEFLIYYVRFLIHVTTKSLQMPCLTHCNFILPASFWEWKRKCIVCETASMWDFAQQVVLPSCSSCGYLTKPGLGLRICLAAALKLRDDIKKLPQARPSYIHTLLSYRTRKLLRRYSTIMLLLHSDCVVTKQPFILCSMHVYQVGYIWGNYCTVP